MFEELGGGRVEITDQLSEPEAIELTGLRALHTIQFSSSISKETFKLLEAHLFSKRNDVVLRAHSFYFSTCDLSNLSYVPSLKRLYIDVDRRVENLDVIHSLPLLTELELSVYRLESLEILNGVTDKLTKLTIGPTKSTKPNLSVLSRFSRLNCLELEEHIKGIEVLTKLTQLKELTLRSIRLPNLDRLKGLKQLKILKIKLGGVRDLSALTSLRHLQHLELWQIRGLKDLSFVSELNQLRTLYLHSLHRVEVFPDLKKLYSLQNIVMENMKGLVDILNLGEAPSLKRFLHMSADNMPQESYLPLLKNTSVEQVEVYFGSNRRNQEFIELARQYGKSDIDDWISTIY